MCRQAVDVLDQQPNIRLKITKSRVDSLTNKFYVLIYELFSNSKFLYHLLQFITNVIQYGKRTLL